MIRQFTCPLMSDLGLVENVKGLEPKTQSGTGAVAHGFKTTIKTSIE